MARYREVLDDSGWNEVMYINTYALLMGYLSMAIKGLGFLVITWTTVVLLGGFVSMLPKKDFWSLTFITLVQMAGIFDATLNERLGYMNKSAIGLISSVVSGVMGDRGNLARFLFACALMLVQVLVLAAVLCPLAMIYFFGILMSGGISLWRLVEHDYGGNSNGEANLVPAMDTLYYLALLQGVIFCYKFILGLSEKRVAKVDTKFKDKEHQQVVYNYSSETRSGCEKDPSFAKGRNLITHAVNKIGSGSPLDCIAGVKILYTTICIAERELDEDTLGLRQDDHNWKRMLMKHLVVSASSSTHILKKLLETLDSRGIHDRETRNQAAKIVERLAFNINLEQFPQGIQHISSLIGTFQEYSIAEPYQRDCLFDVHEQQWKLHASPAGGGDDAKTKLVKAYKELLMGGLCILRKLATDENNCTVISDTRDLVSKIMAPVTFDLLDHTTDDHGAWSDVVEGSMRVMAQLISALGETRSKLHREISSCEEAISTLRRIVSCNGCNEGLKIHAIWILAQLYMDIESSSSTDFIALKKENREDFVRVLVGMFTHHDKPISVRGYAGGALSMLCFHGGVSDATIVIQAKGDVVGSLIKVLVRDEDLACRQSAAEILEHLCTYYTKDDEYLGRLKKSMTDAMPELLQQILCYGDEERKRKKAVQPKTSDFAIEMFKILVADALKSDEQDKEKRAFQAAVRSVGPAELLSSLLSLCVTVFISELCPDLAPQLIASSFLNNLKEMLEETRDLTVENLLLFKAIAKMVISMMKHSSGRLIKQEDLASLIKALSVASKKMLDLDHSMVFSSTDSSSATASAQLDRRSLASLVKKAQDLHARMPSTSASG